MKVTQDNSPPSGMKRRVRVFWKVGIVVVAILILTIVSIGSEISMIFFGRTSTRLPYGNYLPGIGASAMAGQATGEVVLSDPRIHPGHVVSFGDRVVFSVRAEASGSADDLSVSVGENQDVVSNLNDIGWPPDEKSFDGIWTGQLDWLRLTKLGADLPVSFEYFRNEQSVHRLESGRLTINEPDVSIKSFNCEPSGNVAFYDDLLLSADLGQADLPGTVVVEIAGVGEFPLSDDGLSPDELPRDGIYIAQIPVPVELEHNVPAMTSLLYRNSTGALAGTLAGPEIIVDSPEVYIRSLTIEPTESVEIGQPLFVKATLNRDDRIAGVIIHLHNEKLQYMSRPIPFDGYEYKDGRRQPTGLWEGELEWPYDMPGPGPGYTISATMYENSRVSSKVTSAPIEFTEPQIEITNYKFSPALPIEMGEMSFLQVHINKPTAAGQIRLMIDGYNHCRLADNGMEHDEQSLVWKDVTKLDGEWVGKLAWYLNPHQLRPGEDLPARIDYVFGEKVYATLDIGTLTIKPADVRIESFFREPSGPVKVGDEVRFIVDFNKILSTGRIKIMLEDGTQLTNGSDVNGERATLEMTWHRIKEPGEYGPVIAKYSIGQNGTISELADEPLIVIK